MASEPTQDGASVEWLRPFRAGGLVLLLLFVADIIDVVLPVRWMDPAWDMQVIGAIVERSPVPVLGFLLFFYGDAFMRSRWTRRLARLLAWLALGLGLLFLLLIPLMVADTGRLARQAETRMTSQLQQQLARAEEMEANLMAVQTQELDRVLERLGRAAEGQTAEAARESLVTELRETREKARAQAQQTFADQRFMLQKRSWKWAIQSLLVAGLLVYLWQRTGWVREPEGR